MSEPQQPYGSDRNMARPLPGATPEPAPAQAAAQPVPDSLAALGARLAQLRESKGWTIDDVSSRLKVSAAKLRALEAGDISQLPDTTFALGVVRSYAKMLGADPAPFTQALRREKGVPQPDLSMPASAGADLPRGRVSLSLGGNQSRHRSWLWGIAALVVAVIALAMWHNNGGESSAWLARLKASANGATAAGPQAASATVAQGETAGAQQASGAEAAAAASNDQAAAAGSDAQVEQAPAGASAAQPAVASPGAAASAAANAAVAQTASAPAVAPASGASAAASSVAGQSTVAVRVTQDSWFSVRQKDGKEVFSGIVRAGESREIAGEPPLKVTIGNKAGLESITLDGQPVDPAKYAAARGNVARFVLP
ncbi:helix-turn-helix domain-containing protein [Paraburkholderia kururiensis]|uniref:DUF4115 domain-containing protein n=1 Tax=Paraburkholderia kururiensis TaxID=984307 RepID=A0ABZ0WJJ4_9BURK|nr:RodZ domain-containing protein [Paraburkholderia kururiensis]WQD77525.1 DUF4115 domain-containing protein [Paraburkholderia kururiensis]